MSQSNPSDPQHIRHLSPEDGEVLDALLAAANHNEHLGLAQARDAQRTERVRALLGLLDALPETPEDPAEGAAHVNDAGANADARVQRTLDAVRTAQQRQRFLDAHAQMEIGPSSGSGGLGWRRLGMAAVAVLLGASLLLPVLEYNRAEAYRLACAANLQTAGVGFNQYAADHGGVLPRGRTQPGVPWWHVGETPAEPKHVSRSNSAHLYLLVRGEYVGADDLICPTNPHAPHGEMTHEHHDWRSPEEVSFSYQNQYTAHPWHVEEHAELAVLADKNPLFVSREGRVVFDADTPFDAPSRAHNQRGQNVLLLDGRVTWTNRPIMRQPGPIHESNIWVAEGVSRYTGTELPGSRHDSFLVP